MLMRMPTVAARRLLLVMALLYISVPNVKHIWPEKAQCGPVVVAVMISSAFTLQTPSVLAPTHLVNSSLASKDWETLNQSALYFNLTFEDLLQKLPRTRDISNLFAQCSAIASEKAKSALPANGIIYNRLTDLLANPQNPFAAVLLELNYEHVMAEMLKIQPMHLWRFDTCFRYYNMTYKWEYEEEKPANEAVLEQLCRFPNDVFVKRPLWLERYHGPIMTCAQNAVIDKIGFIQSQQHRLQLVGSCKYEVPQKIITDTESLPHYDQVFVISHYWGAGFFHAIAEDFPRIGLYHTWLLQHPEVKIHHFGDHSRELLMFLGYDESRLVSGPITTSMVYHPTPIPRCGHASPTDMWAIRDHIHTRVRQFYPTVDDELKNTTSVRILMVHRTRRRELLEYDQIRWMITQKFNADIYDFLDDPSPSVAETFKQFMLADMIIGPHGAGLANIIAARPGTVVLEFHQHKGGVNYCAANFARNAQLKYYGTKASLESDYYGHIHGDIDDTERVIRTEFPQYVKRVGIFDVQSASNQ